MMLDEAFNILIEQLKHSFSETRAPGLETPGYTPEIAQILWLADESACPSVQSIPPHSSIRIISNRFDVTQAAQSTELSATFSDFDFSDIPSNSIHKILYRLSKEKSVIHHIINEAFRLLSPGGELWVSGLKNEGAKTIIAKTANLFGNGHAEKYRSAYLGQFRKDTPLPLGEFLDTQNYPSLRLEKSSGMSFYSKPGLFGWNKIDKGSNYLLENIPLFLSHFKTPPNSLLDLGCGYGYLTIGTRDIPLGKRAATDNNAAAILAMEKNAEFYGINVRVIADDCAASLSDTFDMILCNPPFHQGFDINSMLTERFLYTTKRLLSPQGSALFVVNRFIGIEAVATNHFLHIATLANNGSFKLIMLSNRK